MEQVNKQSKMETMPVNRLMMGMGIPIILSMMLQAFYNIVDSAFVSNMKENGEVEYLPISEHILLRSAILSTMPAKPQIYTDPCPVKDIP